MKTIHITSALVLSLLLISGCSSTGAFHSANLTEVQLSEANYEIIATNVTGESSAGYLFGISSGIGSQQMETLAIARVSGTGMLYGQAIEDLWQNFRNNYGEAEGRNLALVNVRYDTDALNLLIYTQPKVSVRADVVEFN